MEPSPVPAYFSASIERVDELTQVVTLHGELDVASAAQVQQLLVEIARSTVIVDLSHVTFMDSSGFGALMRARQGVEQKGKQLLLRGPLEPKVSKLFEVLGVAEMIS